MESDDVITFTRNDEPTVT